MSRPKGDSQPQAARRANRSGGKTGSGFEQCYNAQLAVEIDSRLIVGQRVSDAPNDKEQLVPTLAAIPGELGKPDSALTDSGFYSEAAVAVRWIMCSRAVACGPGGGGSSCFSKSATVR